MSKGKRDRTPYHGERLKLGHLYTCSKRVPLMPEVNPTEVYNAIARSKRLPAGERFHVVTTEERLNPGAEKLGPRWWLPWTWWRTRPPPLPSWYRIRCASLTGEWYINPTAMIGATVIDRGVAV